MPLSPSRAIDLFKPQADAHPLEFLTGKPRKPASKNNRALILQQEMMDFSDRYNMAIWENADACLRKNTDPAKRLRVETFKVLFCAASMQIAAGRDPTANLLDMYVFVSLGRQMVREKMGSDFWGDQLGAMNATYDSLHDQIGAILVDYIGEKGRAELDSKIRDWQKANPEAIYVSGIRLRDLADLRAGRSRESGPVPFLSEFQKTVGDFEEALHTGERLMFYIERMPRMATMQSFSRSAEMAAASIDTLPQDLQNLADTQSKTIRELLPALHPLVENARATVESYERIQSVGSDSDAEPWTPAQTTETLEKARQAIIELNAAMAAAQLLMSAPQDPQATPWKLAGELQQMSNATIDRIFQRAMWLVAAIFAGAILLIITAAKVLRRPRIPIA